MSTKYFFKAGIIIFFLLPIFGACSKDKDFNRISAFEKNIHDAINKHRRSLNKPEMVLQLLLMDNAHDYSAKMANGTQALGVDGIIGELGALATNLTGDAYSAWVATCQYENADSVMSIILKDVEIKAAIEGDFNQSAVGAVENTAGTFYITHLLMHIP